MNFQIEAAIAKFDKAGNGKLSYVEFCGMMNSSKNRKENGGGGEAGGSGSSGPASKSVTPQVHNQSSDNAYDKILEVSVCIQPLQSDADGLAARFDLDSFHYLGLSTTA